MVQQPVLYIQPLKWQSSGALVVTAHSSEDFLVIGDCALAVSKA